ncbi:MAG: recombinase family protein, partial [Armatimonadia bacterium]
FTRYVAGETIASLTHWLNATRGPIAWGTRWRAQATMNLLRNPAYIGCMMVDGEIVPAQHKPIVDPDLWRQAQERLRENAIIAPAARARSLSPIFRCGLCGGPMKTCHNGPGEEQRAFGCTRRAELPKEERHPATWVSTPKALALVWQSIGYLISEDAIAEAQARQAKDDDDAGRTALLQERQKLEDDIAYNLAAARAGAIDVALLARENAPLNARLEEVGHTLSKQQETRQKLAQLQTVTTAEVLAAVQSGDIETQRRFILRFFQRVEVHQGFLRFVPTVPEVPVFDVEVPKYYAPKRGGKLAEVEFRILSECE